jgi:hypothetical protein
MVRLWSGFRHALKRLPDEINDRRNDRIRSRAATAPCISKPLDIANGKLPP